MSSSTPILPHGLRNLDRKTKLALAVRLEQRPPRQQQNLDKFTRYRTDPVAYAHDVLGITLTADQVKIAESVRDNRYTLVKASQGVGKTVAAAVLANFWFDCWAEHIVYITAPTWIQASGLTFNQVKRQRLGAGLAGRVLDSGWVRDADQRLATAHFIRTLNAETREGFQGQHAAPILVILEEATGIPPYIWLASNGLMISEVNRILAIGNPTDEATAFGAAAANSLWNVLTISGLSHPNIEAELRCQPRPVEGAVELRWLADRFREHCEEVTEEDRDPDCFRFWTLAQMEEALTGEPIASDAEPVWWRPNGIFQGTVLGSFPTQAAENVIPRGWLENLEKKPLGGRPEIGCDPARFGPDRSAVVVRIGPCVVSIQELRKQNTQAIAGACIVAAREWGGKAHVDPKDIRIRVDVTGGLGAGPVDALQAEGYDAHGVNVTETASDEKQFKNIRSELWFEMRERAFAKDLDLSRVPAEMREKLIREWSAPKYRVDGRGHKVVEPKEVTKKLLGYSPDIADAANLAFTRLVGSGSYILW